MSNFKLITRPEELVVGKSYFMRHKNKYGIYQRGVMYNDAKDYLVATYDIIERPTPIAADFDRLVKEQW